MATNHFLKWQFKLDKQLLFKPKNVHFWDIIIIIETENIKVVLGGLGKCLVNDETDCGDGKEAR